MVLSSWMFSFSGNDFEINADWQSLYILSNGKSKNKARFTIRPKFIGEGEISAIFLKSGNFIQLMNIKIQASGSDSIGTLDPPIDPTGVPKVVATRPSLLETESRQPTGFSPTNPIIQTTLFNSSPNAIWTVKPRDLSLVIIPIGTSNFRILFTGVIVGSADLRITLNELQQYIEDARIALNGIVEYVDSKGEKPYQISVSVDSQIQEETQRILATAGFILFQRIFYGRDPKAEKLGDELSRVAKIKSLNIQIVSDEFRLPWGILYLAERLDTNNIDPGLFLGLNHIVEYRSLNLPHPEPSLNIDTSNGLCVSLNLDYRINAVHGGPQFIDAQVQFWKNLPQGSISLLQRNSKMRVLQAFISMNTINDQLMYFNCHAQAISPASDSWLELSDGVPLTLKELEMYAGVHLSDPPFPGRPLVFINACDSAKLSPLFYSGFIPYLLMKGARGAIGTECNVPTVFATEWALMFFKRFLTGVPLGELFLFMRQVYYYRYNNILGLLYAAYCDSDTFIDPHIL